MPAPRAHRSWAEMLFVCSKTVARTTPPGSHAIQNAQHWIHFETYILHDDKIGKVFAEALCERARAGVKVRVLVDWLGSLLKSGPGFWRTFAKAGVEARSFGYPTIDSPLGLGVPRSPQVARQSTAASRSSAACASATSGCADPKSGREGAARYRRDDRGPGRRRCRSRVCRGVVDDRPAHSRRTNCRPRHRSRRAATWRCASIADDAGDRRACSSSINSSRRWRAKRCGSRMRISSACRRTSAR